MPTPAATPIAIETHAFPLTAPLSILIAVVAGFALFLVVANLLSRSGHRRGRS